MIACLLAILRPHWRYLGYVLRHKFYVYRAGRVLGVSLWQLLVHDLSKFGPAEWAPYVRRFYGPQPPSDATDAAFKRAWEHHWQHNLHHPEFWTAKNTVLMGRLRKSGSWGYAALRLGAMPPMPEGYVREMVADWYGAGMANGRPDCWAWYRANRDRYPIREETHALVEACLGELTARGLIPADRGVA